MRGQFSDQGRMFSYVSPEDRVPKGYPLRAVRAPFVSRVGQVARHQPATAAGVAAAESGLMRFSSGLHHGIWRIVQGVRHA
jgi:hypothetical protein